MRLSHLIVTSALVLAPLAARADYLVVLSGAESGTFRISNTPSAHFSPTVMQPDGDVSFTPISSTPFDADITFYNTYDHGGFEDNFDVGTGGFSGPQLYTGTEANPTLVLGTTTLTGGEFITITSVSSTPEPSSLILLGTGALGLVGAARRRLRK